MAFVKLTEETGTRHTGDPCFIWIEAEEIALIYHNGTGTYLSLKSGENTTVTEGLDDVLREVKRQMPSTPFQFMYCSCGEIIPVAEAERDGYTECYNCRFDETKKETKWPQLSEPK